MSARRRQTLSPTLFPFLAVLVCTLGTLILLLALVAQNASDAAQQIADSQPLAEPELDDANRLSAGDAELLIEEEEFRLSELVSFREAQTGDLENRRNQLAHVEDHMRRIRERLQQINRAMEQAFADEPSSATTDEEVKTLQQQLAREELVVKKLREEIATAKPRFVIVPHQGPNGTDRRPIYLECTSNGVTIWPEGVAITRWQLEHSSPRANPLDDALRAARYHAMQDYGDKIPPYPMLLVRPDGVDTYYAARAAMLDWDDQFGYELVSASMSLAYPNPDPEMRERMQYAINNAVQRIPLQSIARGAGGVGGTEQQLEQQLGQPTDPSSGRSGVSSGRSAQGMSANGSANRSVAEDPATNRNVAVPRLSVSQMDREGRQSGFRDHRMYPARSYSSSGNGGGSSSITAEAAKQRLENQLQASEGAFTDLDLERQMDEQAATAVEAIATAGERGDSAPAPSQSMWLNGPTASSQDQASALPAGNADADGRQQAPRQANDKTQNTPGAMGSAGGMMGGNPAGEQQVSQRAQADSQIANQNAATAPRSEPRNESTTMQQRPERLVQRGGADWALPSSVALGSGNEIVRSIRVQVYPDRFVLMPDVTTRTAESFGIVASGGVDGAVLWMATSVRDRVERWGTTAPGARWSPQLKIDVMPGAEQRYSELQTLLSGSGLSIQRSMGAQAETGQRGERR